MDSPAKRFPANATSSRCRGLPITWFPAQRGHLICWVTCADVSGRGDLLPDLGESYTWEFGAFAPTEKREHGALFAGSRKTNLVGGFPTVQPRTHIECSVSPRVRCLVEAASHAHVSRCCVYLTEPQTVDLFLRLCACDFCATSTDPPSVAQM